MMLPLKITEPVRGSCSLSLVLLLVCLLHHNPAFAFSLKNCTILNPENVNDVIVTCEYRDLAAFPNDIPKNATSLDLSSNNLRAITGRDLRCLSKLQAMAIKHNVISQIDDGAFADLGELTYLDMEDNNLRGLSDDTFHGLSKLISLSLVMNFISHISPMAFQPLLSIQTILLGDNLLHHVADFASVFKLPTLNHLLLENNKFTSFESDELPFDTSNLSSLMLAMNALSKFSLQKDVFPRLWSLDLSDVSSDVEWDVADKSFLRGVTSLTLGGTRISFDSYRAMLQTTGSLQTLSLANMRQWIEKGLIDAACQIPSLRTLEVKFSNLENVDDNLLRRCSQLTDLSLFANNLPVVSCEHSLRSMTQLRSLRLSSNQISEVPLAIRGASTLEVLDLSDNLIRELECDAFVHLTRLTELNLNGNHISNLQGCVFQTLSHLEVLNIEQNTIFTFDNTFKANLQSLKYLKMHNNALLQLKQGDFRNLSSLRLLDLESETSFKIDHGAFEGLDSLQTLSVSIRVYDKEVFRGLPQIVNLTLHLSFKVNQQNSQQNDEPPFSHLSHLKRLTIKVYDQYRSIPTPDQLKGLRALESLVTEGFFRKSLHPDTFKYTPLLKHLQVINSDLSHLTPELFWPIPNLQTLDLTNNKIRSLDFLVTANLHALSLLTLSENGLSVISQTVFQSLPALTYLDLTDNPLTCECSNSGFNQWVQSNNQTQVVNGHQYTCAFPVSQQGQMFLDFDVQSCWVDASFVCFISSSCLVVLTLLASFIYHFLRWQLAYAYYLFLAFLYDKKRRRRGKPLQYDAFVSYNVHDEAWVCEEMLPVLEGQQGWRLCLHHRDFQPGKPIVDNITDAIYGSRRTICVISQHYLQSEWCSREIQMASFRLFDEQEDVLILLFLEDIPAMQLSPYYRMRSVVKRRTYLSWPQAGRHPGIFWENVRRALKTCDAPAENMHPLAGYNQE
uniref:Toll-like receptor 23-1 n=1 Tax=Sillago sinica TaxID=907714 RepID=A0A5J6SBB3_9TELE|nr:toll-like receptor 23-1 [Sillago sinica]